MFIFNTLLTLALAFFITQANANDTPPFSAEAAKACLTPESSSYFTSHTSIPNLDDNAAIAICKDAPSAKLSNQFTEAEIKKGTPIFANSPMILLYATQSGFRFAEYPSFYYFVFYHDEYNTIDVGVLPSHIMPIKLENGKEGYLIQEGQERGVFLNSSELDSYAIGNFSLGSGTKARVKYLDRYQTLLRQAGLPKVTLKTTTTLSTEEIRACIVKNASDTLWARIDKMTDGPTYSSFHPFEDEVAAYQAAVKKDSTTLKMLKDRYLLNEENFINEYIKKAKSNLACNSFFNDEDYRNLITKNLKYFMTDYLKAKKYIDQL